MTGMYIYPLFTLSQYDNIFENVRQYEISVNKKEKYTCLISATYASKSN